MADDEGGFRLREPHLGDSLAPQAPHLIDPAELQLHVDPSLLGPGGGTPGAMMDLFGHLTDPAPPPPFNPLAPLPPMPAPPAPTSPLAPFLPRGVELDENGIGTTRGDWQLRFMPYIPYLNEP